MILSVAHAPATLNCRQTGSGPAVLCLHSSGSSSAQWKALTGRLAARRILVLLRRGAPYDPAWVAAVERCLQSIVH